MAQGFAGSGQSITVNVGGGGVALSAGTQSVSTGTLSFANSNGITFGMSGSNQITASHNGLTTAMASNRGSDFVQATAAFAGTNASGTIASNGISVSVGNYITTARASTDAMGLATAQSNVTWTANSAGLSLDARGYAGTGTSATNASVTLNSNGLAISVAAPGGGGLTNINLSAGTTSNNLSAFVFSNSNNVTFGLNGSTVTGSASFAAQTVQTLGFYASNLTTGQSSSSTYDARSLTISGDGQVRVGNSGGKIIVSAAFGTVFAGTDGALVGADQQLSFADGNGVSFGMDNGTITASVSPGGGGLTNINVSAGTTSGNLSNFVVSNSNGLSFGLAGSTLTGTVRTDYASSNHGHSISLYGVGNTTQSTSDVQPMSSLVFAGAGEISVAMTNGSIVISAPVDAGASPYTATSYEPFPMHNTGTGTLSFSTGTAGDASFFPFPVEEYVAAGVLNILVSMNLTTASTNSYNQSREIRYGLYSRGTGTNSTTLSRLTSGQLNILATYNNSSITLSHPFTTSASGYGYTTTGSAGLNLSSQYTGMKIVGLPINSTLSPGDYWLGIHARVLYTNTSSSGVLMSLYGNAISLSGMAPMGQLSSAWTSGTNINSAGMLGGAWIGPGGRFSHTGNLTSLPDTLAISALSNSNPMQPYLRFWSA